MKEVLSMSANNIYRTNNIYRATIKITA